MIVNISLPFLNAILTDIKEIFQLIWNIGCHIKMKIGSWFYIHRKLPSVIYQNKLVKV